MEEVREAGEGIRTPDPLITNQMLYQLSYAGIRIVINGLDHRLCLAVQFDSQSLTAIELLDPYQSVEGLAESLKTIW